MTLTFLDDDEIPAIEYGSVAEFVWTQEELDDAVSVGMDRLYLGDTTLDEYLDRPRHLDRIKARVRREQRKQEREANRCRWADARRLAGPSTT